MEAAARETESPLVTCAADGKEAIINCKDKTCESIISEISAVSGKAELEALMKANGLKGVLLQAKKFF